MTEGQIVDAIGEQQIETNSTAIVKAAVTVIPSAEQLMAADKWEPIRAQIEKAAARAQLVTVETLQDKATAETYARLLNPVVKKLDKKRLDITHEIKMRLIDPINHMMKGAIDQGKAAVDHLNDQVRAFNRREIEKQQEAQRQADADAARRLKLQARAVERGGQRRQEIVAEEIPKPETIVSDTSSYFRLAYKITDESAIPKDVEFRGQRITVCKPDPGAISRLMGQIEADFSKKQKGFADVPQPVPGVEFFWNETFRR